MTRAYDLPVEPAARPRGRAAVMDAVLDAATELFASQGPRAVTVRDVAAAAGVNHALVHRYFGTKEGLVEAVLVREADRFKELVSGRLQPAEAVLALFRRLEGRRTYVQFLARAVLDGMHPERLQSEFPTLRGLLAMLAARSRACVGPDDDPVDLRVVVAAIAAMALGWELFEDYLVTGVGLGEVSREQVSAELERLIGHVMVPAGPQEAA